SPPPRGASRARRAGRDGASAGCRPRRRTSGGSPGRRGPPRTRRAGRSRAGTGGARAGSGPRRPTTLATPFRPEHTPYSGSLPWAGASCAAEARCAVTAVAALAALPASLLTTGLLLRGPLARRVVATPTSDRWHRHDTPLLGGIGIFVGFLVGV